MEVVDIQRLGERIKGTGDDIIYAGIVALNRVAWKARVALMDTMPDVFTIRNKWVLRQIRYNKATKQKPQVEIYDNDWFMPVHEEGGKRDLSDVPGGIKAIAPGIPSMFWIPVDVRKAAGKNFKDKIPVSFRPQNLVKGKKKINKNRPFIQKLKNGNYMLAVRQEDERYPIQLLYYGVRKPLQYPAKKWFFSEINDAYNKHLESEYVRALQDVMKGMVKK